MGGTYPVDNNTYNLLQILTSKLEAIEAYRRYLSDADTDTKSFLEECIRSDEQSVQRAIGLLRTALSTERSAELAGVR